jgi:hypothetical protein
MDRRRSNIGATLEARRTRCFVGSILVLHFREKIKAGIAPDSLP